MDNIKIANSLFLIHNTKLEVIERMIKLYHLEDKYEIVYPLYNLSSDIKDFYFIEDKNFYAGLRKIYKEEVI